MPTMLMNDCVMMMDYGEGDEIMARTTMMNMHVNIMCHDLYWEDAVDADASEAE